MHAYAIYTYTKVKERKYVYLLKFNLYAAQIRYKYTKSVYLMLQKFVALVKDLLALQYSYQSFIFFPGRSYIKSFQNLSFLKKNLKTLQIFGFIVQICIYCMIFCCCCKIKCFRYPIFLE